MKFVSQNKLLKIQFGISTSVRAITQFLIDIEYCIYNGCCYNSEFHHRQMGNPIQQQFIYQYITLGFHCNLFFFNNHKTFTTGHRAFSNKVLSVL